MLKIDRDVSSIPPVTYAMRAEESEFEDDNAAIGKWCTVQWAVLDGVLHELSDGLISSAARFLPLVQ